MATVVNRPDLSEFENIRLHNIANMFVNITEEQGTQEAYKYLAAQLKNFTVSDVKPYVDGVMIERGYK